MMYEFNKMGTVDNPYNVHIYGEEDFEVFCKEYFKDSEVIKGYNNAIVSFDTETTSTVVKDEKFAFVYTWQLAFGKEVWFGRYIECLIPIIQTLNKVVDGKLVIWVHNLSFDWNFFRTLFIWDKYLFMSKHKPVYTLTGNVEFRCTYLLTNKNLDAISKDDIDNELYKKRTGEMDYNVCRLPSTPLTEQEFEYCIYDVLTMNEFLIEYKEKNHYKSFKDFPYTKTGRIRKMFKDATINNQDRAIAVKYRKLMNKLVINDYAEYSMLQRAFQGGFTHANANIVGKVIENVGSVDVASEYPGIIVRKKFPMSKGVRFQAPDETTLNWILKNKLSIFNIYFKGVNSKINFEHYWSESKAFSCIRPIVDNGRLVKCDELITTMTNIDLEKFLQCYDVESMVITDGYWYEADYLPIEVVKLVLDLYHKKTKYKRDEEHKTVYKAAKEDINCVYGCMVTDIVRPTIEYNNTSDSYILELTNEMKEKQLQEYNDSNSRFLFYPWGVFVTAHARAQLWDNILMLKNDYNYGDTDSNKFSQIDNNLERIDKVNTSIIEELKRVSKDRNIPWESFAPKDKKDIERPIGIWEYEGKYERFKSLGAKRYLTEGYEYNEKTGKDELVLTLTCAGWNKKKGVEYLKKQKDPFETFRIGLVVPPEFSGRTSSTYSSSESLHKAVVRDYMGKEEEICSNSWIHIEPTSTSLDASAAYMRYLNSIRMLEECMRLC